MIPTTYNSVDVYLLNLPPDWDGSKPFSSAHEVVLTTETSLTGRESVRPFSVSLRSNLTFRITVSGAVARKAADAFRTYQTEPLLVPFWPGVVEWSSLTSRRFVSGLSVAFKADWSQWEIFEDVAPSWPADTDFVAPLLCGRMEKRSFHWLSPEVAQIGVEFIEASKPAWSLVPNTTLTFTAGPMPSEDYTVAPQLFPVRVNFDGVDEGFSVRVMREPIGFGRAPTETLYPSTTARTMETAHTADGSDQCAAMLVFWARHGAGNVFWAPTWRNVTRITETTDTGSTLVIPVSDTDGLRDNDWVAFHIGGDSTGFARIVSHTSDSITIDSEVGTVVAGETVISHLLLCRLDKPRLTFDWLAADVAQCRIPIREVPAEYSPAADETLGTTLGAIPVRVFLYDFTTTLNGTTYHDRYTSFEEDVVLDGVTYTACPGGDGRTMMDHGQRRQGLALDRDELEIHSYIFSGNPLLDMATLRSDAQVFLTVRRTFVIPNRAFSDAFSDAFA